MLQMGVIVTEPLLQRWERALILPWARHPVVMQEAEKGAQSLGRFRQVSIAIFGKADAIAVDESVYRSH